MKYAGMPFGMWMLFAGSFQKQLTTVLGYDAATAKAITKKAKLQYRQIIAGLPEFEKADRFKMNLVNCAMVGAFILSMPQRPEVDRLTDYYAKSMMTKPMQWFCRKSGKSKFTAKDIAAMKATAALKAAAANLHGLGPGVYPQGAHPYPAHPQTLSYLEVVFVDEITPADRAGRQSMSDWLRTQPADVQEQVLGIAKAQAFRAGGVGEADLLRPWREIKPKGTTP